MRWYSTLKYAEISPDWWKNFGYHFSNVLDHFFPNQTNVCYDRHPKVSDQPMLCNNYAGTGKTVFPMAFDTRLCLQFGIAYNGLYYQCQVQMYMKDDVSGAAKYQGKLDMKVDESFVSSMEAVSIFVYTHKVKGQATTIIPNGFEYPMKPYEIVQKIYMAIMSDGGGGTDEVKEPDPTPSDTVSPYQDPTPVGSPQLVGA